MLQLENMLRCCAQSFSPNELCSLTIKGFELYFYGLRLNNKVLMGYFYLAIFYLFLHPLILKGSKHLMIKQKYFTHTQLNTILRRIKQLRKQFKSTF